MTEFATIYIQDNTTPGTFSEIELERLVWAIRYQGLYQYNRSPWVEHGYDVFAVGDVKLLERGAAVPDGGWLFELLDTSDQPGALGYHEDRSTASTKHSTRGLAAGTEVPLGKIFAKTAKEDGVEPSEVVSHEVLEALVDPWVNDESKIRKYLDTAAKEWWIGEVGDPVQGRGYDVGSPEGRPCGVPEATVADFGYPKLWGQEQTRTACSFTEDTEAWPGPPNSGLEPFHLAPEGYMSVAPEGDPTNWTQIYGSDKQKAEAAEHAFERPDDVG